MRPYYQDEACTLYHAQAETMLPALPAQSVHLVLVDPPYFRVKEEGWDRQWKIEAAYLEWLRWLCTEWRRLLTPNGSLYCFASPQMAWQVEGIIREQFHVLQPSALAKNNRECDAAGEQRRSQGLSAKHGTYYFRRTRCQ